MKRYDSKEIFGAEIQYFRLDPEYWEKIIIELKKTGLRCVTTYVQWKTHAVGLPDKDHPAGIMDFEGKTDPRLNVLKFLELVEKHGLNLNFRCGPFCCNEMVHGGYPEWLVNGDPNMMVWDYQNRTTKGYWIAKEEGSQPSYLHPEYLDLCSKWIKEVDRIVVPHLKVNGGCITMLNLDNEISYIVQDGYLSSDYNPVNVERGGFYHQFLQRKYESADQLPYSTKYLNIEDVPAPRKVPDNIDINLAYYTDWCEFKQWVMTQYIVKLREMHQSNGVKDVIFMANLNPHLPEGVPTRMPGFEEATQGIVGYDFYRGTFMSYSGYHSMARVLKLMNASLGYTWSSEFMAGTWEKVLNGRVSDEHMRFMARCALAHGCKAIAWFMFHDRDCWGDSPVSSHGHLRPSIKVLSETVDILFNKIRDWDNLVPQGDVAVIYDLSQHWHTYLGDPMPCADNELYMGVPNIHGIEAGKASKEYFGILRLIEQAGYQGNVIDIMHSRNIPEKYALVFLPGAPVIENIANRALISYINSGGTVVLSGTWPLIDEFGESIEFIGLKRPEAKVETVEISVGKGKLIWNKTFIAQDDPEKDSLVSIALVASILEACGIEPWVKIANEVKMNWVDWKTESGKGSKEYAQPRNLGSAVLQKSELEQILFVMNHYPDAAKFILQFKDKTVKRLINLTTNEATDVIDGKTVLDIDRKCAEIYRLV